MVAKETGSRAEVQVNRLPNSVNSQSSARKTHRFQEDQSIRGNLNTQGWSMGMTQRCFLTPSCLLVCSGIRNFIVHFKIKQKNFFTIFSTWTTKLILTNNVQKI